MTSYLANTIASMIISLCMLIWAARHGILLCTKLWKQKSLANFTSKWVNFLHSEMCTYNNWRNDVSLSANWCWGGCNPERFLLCSMPLPGAAILHSCQAHSSSVSSSWRCSSISIQTRMLHFCSWSLRQGMRDSMAFQQKRLWHHLLTRHYVVSS